MISKVVVLARFIFFVKTSKRLNVSDAFNHSEPNELLIADAALSELLID